MLGENIKKYRQEKGITQEQLAVQLNVVRQTVSKWEKGLSVPDAENLSKISEILEVSVNKMLDIEESINGEEEIISDDELKKQLQDFSDYVTKRNAVINKIKTIAVVVIVLMILGAIYPKWNEIWYEFGQNIYHMQAQ